MSSIQKVLKAILRSLSPQRIEGFIDGTANPPTFTYEDHPDDVAARWLQYNLLRKQEVSSFGVGMTESARIQEAVESFLEVEERMSYINWATSVGYFVSGNPTLATVIHTAQRKIQSVLGAFDLDDMIRHCSFSSGASTRLRRANGHPFYKYKGRPEVSHNCALLAVCAIWHSPVWRAAMQAEHGRESDPTEWVKIVSGSEYFTVPKTASSVRGAAKEAEMNMYLQKGIGTLIRKKLKRVGVDLDEGQVHNQLLARIGSRTGALSTLDLASASDSVSMGLVRELLPPDWVRFIEMTRSERIRMPDGSLHVLSKVSSMGNGFTFELESLIFWALTVSVQEYEQVSDRRFAIYGDDIIVHNSCANTLIRVLEDCGFEVNKSKSFVDGPFRESCGGHYFLGVEVTPFYVKDSVETESDVYHLLNRFRLWGFRHGTEEIDAAYKYAVKRLLVPGYCEVPADYGTRSGMIVTSPPCQKPFQRFRRSRQTFGWAFSYLAPTARTFNPKGQGGYVSWWNSEDGEVLIPRGSGSTRFRKKRACVSWWPDCEIGSVSSLIG